MMRILVTGTSGHVGGAIARHLIESGHDVIGLSRRRSHLTGLAGELAVDLAKPDALAAVDIPRCDAIVHTAANLDKSLFNTEISMVNGAGTQALLKLAADWQVSHVVYLSGVPVIGLPVHLPVTEDHPVAPPTAYHASKLYGEYLVDLLGRTTEISALSLRLTSPVGPGMPANRILSVFVRRAQAGEPLQLYGKGTRRQNYVDVRDVAGAVENALNRQVSGVFNIAGANSISNYELAQRCIRVTGSVSNVEFIDQPDPHDAVDWAVSIEKAAHTLGYAPQYDIVASIAGMLAHP